MPGLTGFADGVNAGAILKKEIVFIFLILSAGYLSFQNTLSSYFVADDFFLIYPYSWREVLLAFGGEGLANQRDRERPILGAPSRDEQGNPLVFNETYYRPMVRLSAFIDRQIWGFNPFGYHLTNLLLHLATSFVVYLWVKALLLLGTRSLGEGGRRGVGAWGEGEAAAIALAVGLLFGTHPVHVEAVAWLSGRVDLLCGFFYVAGLLFFTRYLAEIQRAGGWVIGQAAFIGALMSKEMALTLPLVVFWIDLILGRGSFLSRLRRIFPFFLILAVYLFFRFVLLGGIGGYLNPQGSVHLRFGLFVISILGWYARQLMFPFEAIWPPDLGGARYLVLLLYIAPFYGLLRACIKGSNSVAFLPGEEGGRTPRVGEGLGARLYRTVQALNLMPWILRMALVACLWIPVTLLPVVNIAAERFLYIPSVGFLLLLGLGLEHLLRSRSPVLRAAGALTLGIWVALNVFETREKNERWHRAGEVVRGVQDQMKAFYPAFPRGAHLFFLDLPDNYRGAYIYRNGIAGSMRLAYGDYSLRADSLISILLLNPETFVKGQHFIFQYQRGRVVHREDLEDLLIQRESLPSRIGRTGVEAPVDIVVQSAGLHAGDLGNIFVNGQNVSLQRRGYNVVVVHPRTGEVEGSVAFDTHRLKGDSHRLATFIQGLERGKIVILALKDEGALSLTAEAVEVLKTLGAREDLRGKLHWSHALIGVKGARPGEALEASSSEYVKLEVAGK